MDSCIWSLALRHKKPTTQAKQVRQQLTQLIQDHRVALLGCIRQEILSGIQGSHTDFLICAVAVERQWPIFTTDKDFTYFAKALPIALYSSI